jgi:hypothetical protein
MAVEHLGLMTLEEVCEILNREGYLREELGKANWYVRPWNRTVGTGLGHHLDEFTAVAIAEKYQRQWQIRQAVGRSIERHGESLRRLAEFD